MYHYEPVIGLEVHAQLSTMTKIFCGCSSQFGADPNTQVCPVCLGLPGALPVLNRQVVDRTLCIALSVGSTIQPCSRFLRKNYFYPDLPKGYQISQFQSNEEMPLATGGFIEIHTGKELKKIRLVRIHMEEDAGKSIHDEAFVAKNESWVDVNRCGVPLIEIVSEPDISTPEEAFNTLTRLRQILIYTGVSEGDMEKGHIRIDANISIRPVDSPKLGTKTEVKNLNSLRNCQRAIEAEIRRQTEILETGKKILQETLLYDTDRETVRPIRSKEFSEDYRYFPEPDLVSVVIDEAWIERIRSKIPELPSTKRNRFESQYNLKPSLVELLTNTRQTADYYESVVASGADPLETANWIQSSVLRILNEKKIEISDLKVPPENLARLIKTVSSGRISTNMARAVFNDMAQSGQPAEVIIEKQGLFQISNESTLQEVVETIIVNNPEEVERYRNGHKKLLSFFMGQIMKTTKGQANPKLVSQLLQEKLG